ECCRNIWPDGQLEVGIHQCLSFVGSQFQLQLVCREDKSVLSDLPEIGVVARRHPQPGIFELPGTPFVAQSGAFAGKEFFRQGKERSGVEDWKSVEGDCFYLPARGLKHSPPCSSDEARCCCYSCKQEKHPPVH